MLRSSPGGSLELANRNVISGSVRLVYAVLYALFLGFGLSMGSELYLRMSGESIQVSSGKERCQTLGTPS